MITPQDVKDFLNEDSFPDTVLQEAIDLAVSRVKRLTGLDPLPQTPEVKKALTLIAVAELSSRTNLYWKRGDNYEVINVKNLIAEAERLLGLVPDKVGVKWMSSGN